MDGKEGAKIQQVFVPRDLKSIEVDTEKRIFRINGEDFGKDCTGFSITCHKYDSFDIRVEVDTTVRFVSIKNGECVADKQYTTNTPHFSQPY